MDSALAVPAPASTLGFLENAIATFEGIERLAKLMAAMGTMPVHLANKPADCFRIVVQAAKWGMDPFAVAECTSLVHGRMCYEGKLVAAVLYATNALDGRLSYEFSGAGQDMSIVVTGKPRGGEVCSITGTVKDWRTTTKGKDGSGNIPNAWDKDPRSMLVYRGTRQWTRLYKPEAFLGIVTPDEMDEPREVQGVVTETVPATKPAKVRELPTETVEPTPAATQQTITATPAPTLKELNESAVALHKDFGRDAVEALKIACQEMGIGQISACPAAGIAKCFELLKVARAHLTEAAAKAKAGGK